MAHKKTFIKIIKIGFLSTIYGCYHTLPQSKLEVVAKIPRLRVEYKDSS